MAEVSKWQRVQDFVRVAFHWHVCGPPPKFGRRRSTKQQQQDDAGRIHYYQRHCKNKSTKHKVIKLIPSATSEILQLLILDSNTSVAEWIKNWRAHQQFSSFNTGLFRKKLFDFLNIRKKMFVDSHDKLKVHPLSFLRFCVLNKNP